jgi:hypothetical protein
MDDPHGNEEVDERRFPAFAKKKKVQLLGKRGLGKKEGLGENPPFSGRTRPEKLSPMKIPKGR